MFALLDTGVREVVALDHDLLDDSEVLVAAVEVSEAVAALQAAQARLLATIDARKAYAPSGARSAAAWMAHRTHTPKAECGSLLKLGRLLRWMPEVRAAFEAGRISVSHVRRLVAARNPRTLDAFARDENQLVEWASTLHFVEFCEELDGWLLEHDPDGTSDDAMNRRDRRNVTLAETLGGMWHGHMLLDQIDGRILHGELSRLEQQMFEADWKDAEAHLGHAPLVHDLARTPAQRRADALIEMAVRSAAMPEGSRKPKPLFVVTIGENRVKDLIRLDSGAVLPASAFERWFNTAEMIAFLIGDDGRNVTASRRRNFEGTLRVLIDALEARCYHRTCDTPSHQCQGDHATPHSQGGPTTFTNGRPACGYHNRLRNHGGDSGGDSGAVKRRFGNERGVGHL